MRNRRADNFANAVIHACSNNLSKLIYIRHHIQLLFFLFTELSLSFFNLHSAITYALCKK